MRPRVAGWDNTSFRSFAWLKSEVHTRIAADNLWFAAAPRRASQHRDAGLVFGIEPEEAARLARPESGIEPAA